MIPTALPSRHVLLLAKLFLVCLLLPTAFAAPGLAQDVPLLAPEPTVVSAKVGFQGRYRLGCWTPLVVELRGGTEACTGRVIASVPDTDGIQTRTFSDASRPVGIDPGQTTTVRLLIRVGQAMSSVQVQFVSNDGKLSAKRTFRAGTEATNRVILGGVPSTNRILLEFGPSLGFAEVVRDGQSNDEQLTTHVAHLEQAIDLPTAWYGYESVDTVLLTTSEPERYRPLLQNQKRIEALDTWIRRGGRLVLFCGSAAEELLGKGGALASFAPGKFEKLEQLRQAQSLESFSGSDQPITRDRRLKLSVPSLVDVCGKILASAGKSETNIPLVVRTRRGFGEIVFVGLDFDSPPLRDWPGRTSFLRRVFDWQQGEKSQQATGMAEVEDLSGVLRTSLDSKFVDVKVIPFGWVALLVGAYILLIGPGDYLFVKRFLCRMELTWITFPLIVFGVSAAAYGIANHMKGDQLLVNQVEIIDVDCTADIDGVTGSNVYLARGTVWTHLFTPQVSEFDLSLKPSYLGQAELDENEQLVSWLGLPGYGLGGMLASGSQTSVFDSGYQYGDQQATLERLPVQVWSTKTLTARWSARVNAPVFGKLRQNGEELLFGPIQNNSDIELEDCVLLYGRWAYNLGRLPAGKTKEINDSLRPRMVKTLLTSATAGDESVSMLDTAEDGTVSFGKVESDMARLIKAMMFYKAINGQSYTNRYHRYQSFVDLSTVLDHDDQAILLARCKAPGTNWIDNGKPLANEKDRRWTYYRFIMKVESSVTETE